MMFIILHHHFSSTVYVEKSGFKKQEDYDGEALEERALVCRWTPHTVVWFAFSPPEMTLVQDHDPESNYKKEILSCLLIMESARAIWNHTALQFCCPSCFSDIIKNDKVLRMTCNYSNFTRQNENYFKNNSISSGFTANLDFFPPSNSLDSTSALYTCGRHSYFIFSV